MSNENKRILFIESRDGVEEAIMFAKRTIKIYRTAVLMSRKRGYSKPHHASTEQYRRTFYESYCSLKAYVASKKEL